jgi:hypothetical protein
VVGLCTPARIFITMERLGEVWSENGRHGTPPFVAGLALAVLAAGEMATDDNATQANYYVRLNALLGVDSRERPERFEGTLELWRLLQEWLCAERRGELVVRGSVGARRFVDPVKSQCLVRSCDVEDLATLLRAVDVQPGRVIEPADVLPALRAWLSSAGARSRLALLLGRDPDEAALQQAAEALCDAVEDYSSEKPLAIEAPRVRRVSRATLAIRPNRYPNLMWKRAEWFVRLDADPEADEPECLVSVGDRVLVARLDVRVPATYDALLTLAEAAQILRRQMLVVDEDGVDVSPQLQAPVWFQDGSASGRPGSWELVEAPAAGVAHAVILLGTETFDQIKLALEQTPSLITGSADGWPGPDVYAVCAVAPRAGAILPGNVAVRSRPPILRLHGGLAIRRRVYLRGALPSAVVPEAAAVRVESVGRPDAIKVTTSAELGMLDLAEGRYTLRCEGAAAEIFIVEPRWRECVAPRDAPLDHEVCTAFADAVVRGALVKVDRPMHVTYLCPGTHYRLYSPNMTKGVAAADAGVHEIRTAESHHQVVVMKRIAASAPLPRADCFGETADNANTPFSERQRDAVERLLEYVSSRGAGPIDALRSHCMLIAGENGTWHSSLSTLEDLGHLDISWECRRWTVAPPSLCARAVDHRQAVLVGTRTRQTVTVLREHGVDAWLDERVCDPRRSLMPACVVVPNEVASALTLAPHVRPLGDMSWWIGAQFSPSPRVRRTLERWAPRKLRWADHGQVAELDGPALYRWREHGVVVHYLVSGAVRARVRDPAAAKWFLAATDRSHLVYEPRARRLLVPLAIGLPRIWRRVCTIASGLVPVREGRLLVYEDIPLDMARAMAVRLNQPRGEGLL